MSGTLTRYNYSESDSLEEILKVLEIGLDELKTDAANFVTLVDSLEVPPQYFDLLQQTLGLHGGTGLTEHDRRAVIAALGWAYHFKGSNHGLRLIARALWRYASFREDYKDIMVAAEAAGVTTIAGWPAFLTANGYTTDDLTRVTMSLKLDVPDSRRYGQLQDSAYRQLTDALRGSSGYERLLRTFRPGFDLSMSTLLGTSQYDGIELLPTSFLMYGRNVANLDGADQNILNALKWNIYPQAKIDRAKGIMDEFIPFIVDLVYNIEGYQMEDTMLFGTTDSVTVTSASVGFGA